jgi:hypothetical protein
LFTEKASVPKLLVGKASAPVPLVGKASAPLMFTERSDRGDGGRGMGAGEQDILGKDVGQSRLDGLSGVDQARWPARSRSGSMACAEQIRLDGLRGADQARWPARSRSGSMACAEWRNVIVPYFPEADSEVVCPDFYISERITNGVSSLKTEV